MKRPRRAAMGGGLLLKTAAASSSIYTSSLSARRGAVRPQLGLLVRPLKDMARAYGAAGLTCSCCFAPVVVRLEHDAASFTVRAASLPEHPPTRPARLRDVRGHCDPGSLPPADLSRKFLAPRRGVMSPRAPRLRAAGGGWVAVQQTAGRLASTALRPHRSSRARYS